MFGFGKTTLVSVKSILYVLVVGLLTSCGFDGGIMDPNSDLSKKAASDISDRKEQLDKALLLDDQVVDWYGNFCGSINYFRDSMDTGDNESGSLGADLVKAKYSQMFSYNSNIASKTASRLKYYPLPDTNKKNWYISSRKLVEVFNELADSAQTYANEISSVSSNNVAALESVIKNSFSGWSAKLKHLSTVIENLKFPFPNQRTVEVAQSLPVCLITTQAASSSVAKPKLNE